MAGLLRLLWGKWYPPAIPTTSFEGKTVLVTGCNTGLGLEAAKHFFALSASTIILAVRDVSKGEAAKRYILETTQHDPDHDIKPNIIVLPLDMSSYESITNFLSLLSNRISNLDVAILNAGVMMRTRTLSPYSWEQTLQINTISTALLALLLLPLLRAAKSSPSPSHLVLVSSGMHRTVTRSDLSSSGIDILRTANNVNPDTYSGRKQYAISKLFVMYVTKALAAICTMPTGKADVIVTACCPGACKSELGRQYDGRMMSAVIWVIGVLFQRSSEEGSRSYVSAATLGVEAVGGFWQHDELKP